MQSLAQKAKEYKKGVIEMYRPYMLLGMMTPEELEILAKTAVEQAMPLLRRLTND